MLQKIMEFAQGWIMREIESRLTFSFGDGMIALSLYLRLINVLEENSWEFAEPVKRRCRIRKLGLVKHAPLSNTRMGQAWLLSHMIPKRFICRDGFAVQIAM
jgi:hypothetical protein